MNLTKVPVAVLTFLAAQLAGAVWWAVGINTELDLIEENRRYLAEVVIPSYEIGDNWDNPHHNNWLKSGGWKD